MAVSFAASGLGSESPQLGRNIHGFRPAAQRIGELFHIDHPLELDAAKAVNWQTCLAGGAFPGLAPNVASAALGRPPAGAPCRSLEIGERSVCQYRQDREIHVTQRKIVRRGLHRIKNFDDAVFNDDLGRMIAKLRQR